MANIHPFPVNVSETRSEALAAKLRPSCKVFAFPIAVDTRDQLDLAYRRRSIVLAPIAGMSDNRPRPAF